MITRANSQTTVFVDEREDPLRVIEVAKVLAVEIALGLVDLVAGVVIELEPMGGQVRVYPEPCVLTLTEFVEAMAPPTNVPRVEAHNRLGGGSTLVLFGRR